MLGTKLLSEILSEREGISKLIKVGNSNYLIIISRSQETLDEATDPWGVRVQMVELKVSMKEASKIQKSTIGRDVARAAAESHGSRG